MTATAIPASAPDGSGTAVRARVRGPRRRRAAAWPGPRRGGRPARARETARAGGGAVRARARGGRAPGAGRRRPGGGRDQQYPAGLDQAGVGEGTAAGLGPALVEAEDLRASPRPLPRYRAAMSHRSSPSSTR